MADMIIKDVPAEMKALCDSLRPRYNKVAKDTGIKPQNIKAADWAKFLLKLSMEHVENTIEQQERDMAFAEKKLTNKKKYSEF